MLKSSPFLWKNPFGSKQSGLSSRSSLFELLKENFLFQSLTAKELAIAANLVFERDYQNFEPIFKQGDRGLGMYLIGRGSVSIHADHGHFTETKQSLYPEEHHFSETNRSRTALINQSPLTATSVTTLGPGNFFGELALIDRDHLRSASAVAVGSTHLIGFFKPELDDLLERHPALAVKIIYQLATVLGKRLVETTDRLALLDRTFQLDRSTGDLL